MAATITVEEERGTYVRSPHRHNGYYAGDFSGLDLTVPFRATTYSPEVYADVPMDDSTRVALGWRHDSNGGDASYSVDVNRVFARVEKSFDLGGDWRFDVAPMAWFYVGRAGTVTDVRDYYGYTSLTAAILQKDGIKLSLTGRGNFDTGRGAAEAFLSYPLVRIGGVVEDLLAFQHGAAARRQVLAVGRDVDVPAGHLLRRGRLAQAILVGMHGACRQCGGRRQRPRQAAQQAGQAEDGAIVKRTHW